MTKAINIVSFDVPFPANYGGVIDVYYKLIWLHKTGVKIHLHCFTYGRKPAKELEEICASVHYYQRKTGLLANLSFKPYTSVSRQSKELEQNLLGNDYPILFEVLHTCYLLNDPRFAHRKKIYRHSNIEHQYYAELAKSEKSFLKKIYLKIEAKRLQAYESILKKADLILAVNKKDTHYFQKNYPEVRSVYLPSFHPNTDIAIKQGKGDYILFHGNLSVSENYEAALWLTEQVFSKINVPVIIAGLNPPDFLNVAIKKYSNIKLRQNPNEEEMIQLIRNAQIHVLYTLQPTGLKLKLLQVLFKGRFVICNGFMISGTDLNSTASLKLAERAEDFIEAIKSSFHLEISSAAIKDRELQMAQFRNSENIQKLNSEVFEKL